MDVVSRPSPRTALALLVAALAAGCSSSSSSTKPPPSCVPSAETCNGLDDDCDGVVDNGDPGGGASCGTGLAGVCAAGVLHCEGGQVVCVQTTQASAETCNGLDDDCDGIVDDGDPEGGSSCTTGLQGVCAAGVWHCQSGALHCVQTTQSGTETCNGLDDDCDGVVDDGNPGGGASCSTGLQGVCAAGALQCLAGELHCVQTTPSGAEVCNGLDDDCGGQVDEGDPGGGASCSTGLPGVCGAGVMHCQNGAVQCVATVAPGSQIEICNGVDDDCDGVVDEGFNLANDPQNCGYCGHVCSMPHAVAGCALSACRIASCNPGYVDLDATPADGCEYLCTPTGPEICGNGMDDDCDGQVDETCYGHAIAIDGTNDFTPQEAFTTTSGSSYTAYVTWDASNLYVAYQGPDVGAAGRWLLVYLDVGPGGLGTGTLINTQQVTLPVGFPADWQIATRLDGSFQGVWNVQSGAWVMTSTSPALTFARSGTFIELAVPRAAIGNPAAAGVVALLMNETAGSEWSYAGLWPDAFPDGYYGHVPVARWLRADWTSDLPPNDVSHRRP